MKEEDRQIVEAAHVAFQLEPPSLIRSVAKDLLAIIDRLDKQLVDQNTKLQMVDDLLADAITEAKTQKEYARQLKGQLTEIRKAGEPFAEFGKHFPREDDDYEVAFVAYADSEARIKLGECRRLAQALDEISPSTAKCQWTLDGDGVYQTVCGGAWQLTSGDLLENEVKFCPFCGGQIEEVK